MRAILTIGPSACGKTTWASDFCDENDDFVDINRDDIRWGIMVGEGTEPSWKNWDWKYEKLVDVCVENAIVDAYIRDLNVIVSDTNIDRKNRNKLVAFLEGFGYEVEYKVFDTPLDVCIALDALREHPVGARTIEKQFEKMKEHYP